MSIFGAMFSGVTGLRAQSQSLAIISDNIANMNTTGYKATVNRFSTLVTAQTTAIRYSSGGVLSHPTQLIDRQGLLESSESATDVAITGQGFFIVNTSATGGTAGLNLFTRAGSFTTDLNGNLLNTSGFYLQGWQTDAAGNILPGTSTSTLDDLQTVNVNVIKGSAQATTSIAIGACSTIRSASHTIWASPGSSRRPTNGTSS
jgi:flagellar hook protein FlgE